MEEIDKSVFTYINNLNLPDFVSYAAGYLHGYSNLEIAFLLFCLILSAVVLGSPKTGVRAAIAIFIVTMSSFFGASYLKSLFVHPYPHLDGGLSVNLRVDPGALGPSSFPVPSVVMFSAVMMVLLFYFPKKSSLFLFALAAYTFMPVYLGVAFPSDVIGSFLAGLIFSYLLLAFLSRQQYFQRY